MLRSQNKIVVFFCFFCEESLTLIFMGYVKTIQNLGILDNYHDSRKALFFFPRHDS